MHVRLAFLAALALGYLVLRRGGPAPAHQPGPQAEPKSRPKPAAGSKRRPSRAKPAAPRKADDLTKITGIGPKIAELLAAEGIRTFARLAETDVERLREILEAAGSRYRLADPETWPAEARRAASRRAS